MKIALKGRNAMTAEEKNKLDLFNKESKLLEASPKLQIPFDFKTQLELALEQICTFAVDRESGGYISRDIVKAEFEANYLMAYHFRRGKSNLILSTDSDMSALGGPTCLSICSFTEEKSVEKKKKGEKTSSEGRFVYTIGSGSNQLMNKLKVFATSSLPSNKIIFTPTSYPL